MKLYSVEDMLSLPPPEWIFHELLQQNSTALLFGPPSIGKSFVALEMAFALIAQHDGVFKPVVDGPVVYVAAEGRSGLGVRIRAWELDRGIILPKKGPLWFIGEAVQVADPKHRRQFLSTLHQQFGDEQPLLIIFDTLARCAVDLDENSARDMGRFVYGLDVIREEFQCSLLVVHHPTKSNEKVARGSGAIGGALDTVISLQTDGAKLKLECLKQKNGERAGPRWLTLKPGDLSCVVDATKVAKERDMADRLQDVLAGADGEDAFLPKRVFMRDAFPPAEFTAVGESPICVLEPDKARIAIRRVSPEDAYFQAWLKDGWRVRQLDKRDKAPSHPFSYIRETAEFWEADSTGRAAIIEARRERREDRFSERGEPWPAMTDLELAWWTWGVAEMGITQSEIIKWYGVPRYTLQQAVKCWREFGLLPFTSDAE